MVWGSFIRGFFRETQENIYVFWVIHKKQGGHLECQNGVWSTINISSAGTSWLCTENGQCSKSLNENKFFLYSNLNICQVYTTLFVYLSTKRVCAATCISMQHTALNQVLPRISDMLYVCFVFRFNAICFSRLMSETVVSSQMLWLKLPSVECLDKGQEYWLLLSDKWKVKITSHKVQMGYSFTKKIPLSSNFNFTVEPK